MKASSPRPNNEPFDGDNQQGWTLGPALTNCLTMVRRCAGEDEGGAMTMGIRQVDGAHQFPDTRAQADTSLRICPDDNQIHICR